MPYAFADGTICCQTQWSPPTYETNSAFFQNPDCPVNQTSVLDDPSLACCGFNEPLTCEYSTCSHNSEIRNQTRTRNWFTLLEVTKKVQKLLNSSSIEVMLHG